MSLTEHDRFILHRARELTAPGVTTGEAWQRLAREVLRQVADLATRLAGEFHLGQQVTVTDGGWTGTVERISDEDRTAWVRFPDHPELVPYAFEALQ